MSKETLKLSTHHDGSISVRTDNDIYGDSLYLMSLTTDGKLILHSGVEGATYFETENDYIKLE